MKRNWVAFALLASFILASMPSSSAGVIPGTKCAKAGAKQTQKGKVYTCIKLGKFQYWNNGKPVTISAPKSSPTPTPKPTIEQPFFEVKNPSIPNSFDFSNGSNLIVNVSVETNLRIDLPKAYLEFYVRPGEWSVPSQTVRINASTTLLKNLRGLSDYKFEFDLSKFDPIGAYSLVISPFTTDNQTLDFATSGKRTYSINLTRDVWSKKDVTKVSPLPVHDYLSFKSVVSKKYPWEGKNVVLLTDSPNYDPFVISRILNALDAAYLTYSSITGYQPGIARAYKGKLTIAEMTPETVGCGAACGYLGATGIEIQTPLFLRLYNGVRDHDQFDEPLFYELGRNFWNYGKYKQILEGNSGNSKWFDINTTGFAVFMRYLVTEINEIPIGPNDGPNKPGLEFKQDMLNLMIAQRDSKTDNFGTTFFSTKFNNYGFGVYGFWSSLIYYFMPNQNRDVYVRDFLKALSNQRTPTSVAQSVDNVVISIGTALGRDISEEFYKGLNFSDVKSF